MEGRRPATPRTPVEGARRPARRGVRDRRSACARAARGGMPPTVIKFGDCWPFNDICVGCVGCLCNDYEEGAITTEF